MNKELQEIVAAFKKVNLGKTTALATLVKVKGSTYRRPGARMLMTPDGWLVGSISGGCLEGDVFEHAQRVMDSGKPTLVKYDTTSSEDIIWGLGLGCQGIVYVLIESLTHDLELSHVAFLSECFRYRQTGVLVTVFDVQGHSEAKMGTRLLLHPDGTVNSNITDTELRSRITDDAIAAQSNQSSVKTYQLPAGSAEVFIEVIQPPVTLIVFGAGHDTVPVVRLAKELGWQVSVVDSRPAYATTARFPLADAVILAHPQAIHEQVPMDNRTVAVVMTHNYLHDRELLKTLLLSSLPYLGVLGPKRRTEQLLQELGEQGITPTAAQLNHLYAPVGLDIGADTPEAIALAILSEIQTVLTNRFGGSLRNRIEPIHSRSEFQHIPS